jgi:hypothetical protein
LLGLTKFGISVCFIRDTRLASFLRVMTHHTCSEQCLFKYVRKLL